MVFVFQDFLSFLFTMRPCKKEATNLLIPLCAVVKKYYPFASRNGCKIIKKLQLHLGMRTIMPCFLLVNEYIIKQSFQDCWTGLLGPLAYYFLKNEYNLS